MAEIKVVDPVSVPASILQELQDLRACVEALRQENTRHRSDNQRLRQQLDEATLEFVSQTLRAVGNPSLDRPVLLPTR